MRINHVAGTTSGPLHVGNNDAGAWHEQLHGKESKGEVQIMAGVTLDHWVT